VVVTTGSAGSPAVEGADEEKLIREDERVGREYTPKQPGFRNRESAKNTQGDWVVIVHWEDAGSAEAAFRDGRYEDAIRIGWTPRRLHARLHGFHDCPARRTTVSNG
jgi:hypothetical protein